MSRNCPPGEHRSRWSKARAARDDACPASQRRIALATLGFGALAGGGFSEVGTGGSSEAFDGFVPFR